MAALASIHVPALVIQAFSLFDVTAHPCQPPCIVESNGHGPLICHALGALQAVLDVLARTLIVALEEGGFSQIVEGQGNAFLISYLLEQRQALFGAAACFGKLAFVARYIAKIQ